VRRRAAGLAVLAAVVGACTLTAAQVGGKPVSGGNPTPGTAQPDPPNLSDRISLNGCLQPAPKTAAAGSEPIDDNTPSDSRFVLTGGQRVNRVPPGTGQSEIAAKASGGVYRLEGLDSQFSPFVNTRVEISGEIKRAGGDKAPVLLVGFVQKISASCR